MNQPQNKWWKQPMDERQQDGYRRLAQLCFRVMSLIILVDILLKSLILKMELRAFILEAGALGISLLSYVILLQLKGISFGLAKSKGILKPALLDERQIKERQRIAQISYMCLTLLLAADLWIKALIWHLPSEAFILEILSFGTVGFIQLNGGIKKSLRVVKTVKPWRYILEGLVSTLFMTIGLYIQLKEISWLYSIVPSAFFGLTYILLRWFTEKKAKEKNDEILE
ncbi:MAG: hypothetical protein PF447_00305 [Spirochaetaceae bacterium]|jgi:hypothetical protein|nr:hypothetical protein [Spirochaetaceae bacterium]